MYAIRSYYDKLGCTRPFFHALVQPLERAMGKGFPELERQRDHVERVLQQEEERFAETLSQGMSLLEQAIAGLRGRQIPGETVFRLYDTFGFPVDLTADIARERGLSIDDRITSYNVCYTKLLRDRDWQRRTVMRSVRRRRSGPILVFVAPAVSAPRLRGEEEKNNRGNERDKRVENRFFEHGSLAS